MSNQARFLDAYRRIEDRLRRIASARSASTSEELIDGAAAASAIVRRYKRDLHALRSLRNALVHGAWQGRAIAEPVLQVVTQIERIADQLDNPPPLPSPLLSPPRTFRPEDSVGEALSFMNEHAFSQVPVVSERNYVGLLTGNSVARWLAAQLEVDIVEISSATINHVLAFVEPEVDGVMFASTKADCAEVLQQFQKARPRANVVLLTASGKPDGMIGGIVTSIDIPLLLNALEGAGHDN